MLDGAAMRAILLTALATASVLASAAAARQAHAAMPFGPRPGSVAQVQPVTNVCGVNGCARVQTQRVVKHQRGTFVPGRT
jgi:hypothetical protein